MDHADFAALLKRVRQRDDAAARELVIRFEPHVRRMIRLRLTDPALRRQVDSLDVCQSVLANFFIRTALGEFEIHTPQDLIKLLATMARHRLIDHAHRHRAGRRDIRRLHAADIDSLSLAGDEPSASQVVEAKELLEQVQSRLSQEEWQLAEQRAAGHAWRDLAIGRGLSPDQLRMRLTRAIDRVAHELRLDELDHV